VTAEFDLIALIRARAAALADERGDVVLGIGDDAALLAPPPGRQLVAATDTLNSGVHFAADAQAADIGWKALAVNLSDLAAMGAETACSTAPPRSGARPKPPRRPRASAERGRRSDREPAPRRRRRPGPANRAAPRSPAPLLLTRRNP